MSDIFHEVEEDLRNERLKGFWNTYGLVIIGIAVLIILATAGYRGYIYWQNSTAAREGDQFIAAIDLANSGETGPARDALLSLASDSSDGYALLSRFRAATEAANAGEADAAIATFSDIANDGAVSEIYRTLAAIRIGYLQVDGASYGDMVASVGAIAEDDGPWAAAAMELLALSSYSEGDLRTTRDWLDRIQGSASAGPDLLERTRVLGGLVRGELGPEDAELDTAGASSQDGTDGNTPSSQSTEAPQQDSESETDGSGGVTQ